MTQPNLFTPVVVDPQIVSPSVPYAKGSETSKAGAVKAKSFRTRLHRRMVELYALGPLTDAEMAARLGVQRSTINARRSELQKAGKVDAKGKRINTASGIPNVMFGLKNTAA